MDLRSVLPRLLVPTLVVHASENAFVLPAHAESLAEARGGGSVAVSRDLFKVPVIKCKVTDLNSFFHSFFARSSLVFGVLGQNH